MMQTMPKSSVHINIVNRYLWCWQLETTCWKMRARTKSWRNFSGLIFTKILLTETCISFIILFWPTFGKNYVVKSSTWTHFEQLWDEILNKQFATFIQSYWEFLLNQFYHKHAEKEALKCNLDDLKSLIQTFKYIKYEYHRLRCDGGDLTLKCLPLNLLIFKHILSSCTKHFNKIKYNWKYLYIIQA